MTTRKYEQRPCAGVDFYANHRDVTRTLFSMSSPVVADLLVTQAERTLLQD